MARQSNAIASVARDGRILIRFRLRTQSSNSTGVSRITTVVNLRQAMTHDQSPASALQWFPRNFRIATNKSVVRETSANQLVTFLHLGTTSLGFELSRRAQEKARRKGGEINASKPTRVPRRSRMTSLNVPDWKRHGLAKEKGAASEGGPYKTTGLS